MVHVGTHSSIDGIDKRPISLTQVKRCRLIVFLNRRSSQHLKSEGCIAGLHLASELSDKAFKILSACKVASPEVQGVETVVREEITGVNRPLKAALSLLGFDSFKVLIECAVVHLEGLRVR